MILTRRINESLTIGKQVTVVVLGVKGRRVRIGIGAPEDIAVLPQEIMDKIRQRKSNRR